MGKDLLLNEGVCPPFVDHFLYCLVERIDPQLAIVIGQSRCFSKSVIASFSYCYYERLKWWYFELNALSIYLSIYTHTHIEE